MVSHHGYPRRQAVALGLLIASAAIAGRATAQVIGSSPTLFALDLSAYLGGAERLLATGSPYAPELMRGPVEHAVENVSIAYLYPPMLAQLFVPLLAVPEVLLAAAWTLGQGIALVVVLPKVFQANGGSGSWVARCTITLVAMGFAPFHWATFIGNVSGWIAVATSTLLLATTKRAAWAASFSALVKLTPFGLPLGALLAPTLRRNAAVAMLATLGLSVALGPTAWRAFLDVLPSLIQMPPAPGPYNISPSQLFIGTPLEAFGPTFRVAVAVMFLLGVLLLARLDHRVGWVASATGLYLSATATSWFHYAVVLLPVGIAAWPHASFRLRSAIVAVFVAYGPLWTFGAFGFLPWLATPLWIGTLIWIAWSDALVRHLPSVHREFGEVRGQA